MIKINQRTCRAVTVFVMSLAVPVLSGCSSKSATLHDGAVASVRTQPAAKAEFGQWGVQTQYVSPEIKPADDFYRYVNKGWLDTASIPAGFPFTGSFVDLMLRTELQVSAIISDLEKQHAAPGTPAQQIADMHASYMNMARRNALGSSMLQADVQAVLKIKSRSELARRMGRTDYSSIVSIGVLPDSANPQRYALLIAQGGLGLPGRDYYLKKEEPYAGFRAAYADYIAGVLMRAGVPDATSRAQAVLGFETLLAEKHWTPAQARDAIRNHYPMTVSELMKFAPGFDWQAMLEESGFGDVAKIDVNNDTALRGIAAVFSGAPIDTLRSYTIFHYLDNFAPYLSEEWQSAHFDMHRRKLAGVAEQRPLDVRSVEFLNQTLGEQLGKLYVERYFPPESKASIDKLVKFLRLSFRQRLEKVEWMDEATRKEALAKLDALTTKIGYPEQWHDYSSLVIDRDDLVGNMRRFLAWRQRDDIAKLKEPVRKWEWGMNPQVINAYFNPLGAEIVFPAAILQPPFFDPKADPAVNFGAIGMVIGHEMGHGFDDQGSHYDGSGALRNWWGDQSRQHFEERANRLVDQYNQFSPLPGLNVKGRLTLGENIGDLGGMMIAWSGYQSFVAEEFSGNKAPVLDGYTGDQRFFLGYAQLWRGLYKDDFLRQQVLTNPHSPNEYRVNGVLRNFTPWYETYNVGPGDGMYLPPEQRVKIW
jgi:putative endopeptidase